MSLEKESFHVVIRIPIKRPKGFTEPPSIVWTDEMEHKLWQYMSQKNTDWNEIAEQLGVPTSYIVRHAAFIYETQLRGIHQQLRNNTTRTTKSPTPSLRRPSSIRYSNTFQQQYQMTPQESNPVTTSILASNISINKSTAEASNAFSPTITGRSPSQQSLYKSSSSHVNNNDSISYEDEEETEEEDNDTNRQEEDEDEEEEFSSHFEKMRLQVEEPAFLPRRIEGSTNSLSSSRQQLSLSIQNLRRPINAFIPEVSTTASTPPASGSSSADSHKKILSPKTQSHSNSAINSSTSSFSDISESSVTQSAMEDAFLSNFNHGSKMSLLSFSRKYKE